MKVTKGSLSVEELVSAEDFWIKRAQAHAHSEGPSQLAAGRRYIAAVALDPCTLKQTRRASCASEVD